jgi:hypothetical protein
METELAPASNEPGVSAWHVVLYESERGVVVVELLELVEPGTIDEPGAGVRSDEIRRRLVDALSAVEMGG